MEQLLDLIDNKIFEIENYPIDNQENEERVGALLVADENATVTIDQVEIANLSSLGIKLAGSSRIAASDLVINGFDDAVAMDLAPLTAFVAGTEHSVFTDLAIVVNNATQAPVNDVQCHGGIWLGSCIEQTRTLSGCMLRSAE